MRGLDRDRQQTLTSAQLNFKSRIFRSWAAATAVAAAAEAEDDKHFCVRFCSYVNIKNRRYGAQRKTER